MEKRKINIKELALKARTKSEIYQILTIDGGLYLPPQRETNMKYIQQLCTGKKKVSLVKMITLSIRHSKEVKSKFARFLISTDCESWTSSGSAGTTVKEISSYPTTAPSDFLIESG